VYISLKRDKEKKIIQKKNMYKVKEKKELVLNKKLNILNKCFKK